MKEHQIIHESGPFWVAHEGPGLYRVWENVGTHSVRRGTFHFKTDPDKALKMALDQCNSRAAYVASLAHLDRAALLKLSRAGGLSASRCVMQQDLLSVMWLHFGQSARPWESLAGLRGSADRCTCSDDQLNLVGCDCAAEQNLPVRCSMTLCEHFLRDQEEIDEGICRSCSDDAPECCDPDLWLGPEFADEISLEERWEHYAFEERNGMPYGSSF